MRLSRLEIEDFALIARASLDFADGFTVCSGETGSGKTMLLGSLAFVLGERSSADIVRAGSARARVTLALDVDANLREHLDAAGFDGDDDTAILVREMLPTGKSSARINGRLATSAQLRAVGEQILEAVGQHEQQRLLSRAYQLDVLDAFAGDDALVRRVAVGAAYRRVVEAEAALEELTGDVGRALAELEFARFAAREIDEAAIAPGEDVAVRERRDYLANVERIAAALATAHEALAGSDAGAIEALGVASSALAGIARFGAPLASLAERLATLQSDANDGAIALAREIDGTERDGDELETATARLALLDGLKKKYGGSLDAVLATRARLDETIAREDARDDREAALRAALETARVDLEGDARALSALRRSAASTFETRVASELAALAMPAARFAIVIEAAEHIGPSGRDIVDFALSPNPGEPVRPLARAASGGELSRVLLALVVVLADRRERTALVFDEIDAGIGGATATAVGARIGALARASQVLCVTHLAQIASWADRHYALRKRERAGATVVEIVELGRDRAVLEEIARMLAGDTADVALEHAQTLVRDVRGKKTRAEATA
ncbi:MAG: DNA repair protein RecN [Vulcanimicrobiaceae bacterium]